jgi:hypothetical protein
MLNVIVELRSIQIENVGPYSGAEDLLTFDFSMYNPSANVGTVKTVKTIPYSKGTDSEPAGYKIPDFKKEKRRNRMVFFQEVADELEIDFSAIAVNNPSALEKFLVAVFGAAVTNLAGAGFGAVQNVIANLALSQLQTNVTEKIEALKESQLLGSAEFGMTYTQLEELKGKDAKIVRETIKLPADKAIIRNWGSNLGEGYEYGGQDVLVPPGSANGKIELAVKVR